MPQDNHVVTAGNEEPRDDFAILEAQVAELLAQSKSPGQKDRRKTLGMFDGKEGMDEIFDEALRIREADRKAAREDPHYFDEDVSK